MGDFVKWLREWGEKEKWLYVCQDLGNLCAQQHEALELQMKRWTGNAAHDIERCTVPGCVASRAAIAAAEEFQTRYGGGDEVQHQQPESAR